MYRKTGSYTVEAALLCPFVIMVIVGIICTSFIMHDRGAAYVCISESAEKEANHINSGIGKSNDIYALTDEIYKSCNKSMFLCDVENVDCSYSADFVIISAEITTDIPIYRNKVIKIKQYAAEYAGTVRRQFMVN